MIYVFILLPFVMFLISSYVLNYKKLYEPIWYILYISIYESILSYLVIGLFFLQGYVDYFFYIFITICLIFILSISITYLTRDREEGWDIQLETVKNNLLLFMKTLLPLYFFLIIFRFYHPVIQVILSVGLTVSLYYFTTKYRKKIHNWLNVKLRNFQLSKPSTYVWSWVVGGLIIIVFLLFLNLPTETFKSTLNLSDKAPYMVYDDDIAVDANNDYKQSTFLSLKMNYDIDVSFVDYFYTEDYLYIYFSDEEVSVYDFDSLELLTEMNLHSDYYQDYTLRSYSHRENYEYFREVDNKILLFGEYGIFELDGTSYSRISDISARDTQYFIIDNELKLLESETLTTYNIYEYTDGTFTLSDSFDKTTEDWNYLSIISYTLFYKYDDEFVLFNNADIRFDNKNGYSMSFDPNQNVMVYRIYEEIQRENEGKVDLLTKYIRVDETGNSSSIILDGARGSTMLINNDFVYLCGLERFEVIGDDDLSYISMMNHLDSQPFLFLDEWFYTSRYNYQLISEDTIEYVETYANNENYLIRICHIDYKPVAIDFPFYTHYGILTIIPIIIASLYDFTNYRSEIREKSFDNLFNRQEKEKS